MSNAESGIVGTDAANLIIAGGNGPTIEGRGGADCYNTKVYMIDLN